MQQHLLQEWVADCLSWLWNHSGERENWWAMQTSNDTPTGLPPMVSVWCYRATSGMWEMGASNNFEKWVSFSPKLQTEFLPQRLDSYCWQVHKGYECRLRSPVQGWNWGTSSDTDERNHKKLEQYCITLRKLTWRGTVKHCSSSKNQNQI